MVIFVKAPMVGRAKTRLAAGIGSARAVSFYRQSTDILVKRLGSDPRWRTVLAVDPPAATGRGWLHLWPPHLQRVAQGRGNLGQRLRDVLKAIPLGPVVIIGSDAPQVSRDHIARAFHLLRHHDAVAGPAADGGYWLIGLKRLKAAPGAFLDVRWSGEHALADTLASLPQGFSVARLPVLRDVDEAGDLDDRILLRSIRRKPCPSSFLPPSPRGAGGN
nr:TIGR04282 family arsenosugar biosynthesis glycosyltransferase [Aquisalinus flavus]